MKAVFGDTVYFLALVNPTDQFHRQALVLSREPTAPLVTTEWVLTEVGDALSQPPHRPRFTRLLALLRQQADVEILPASSSLFRRGCELHAKRLDKEWSLTDCISFVVMEERGLTGALTSDHHFEQAGFSVLL
ncbi:MAG: PIN domain-containing protein [Verrucomicrobiota bacterium]